MNLFLGNYVVHKGQPALWELPGDYHLHNITDPELKKIRKSYTKWFTPDAILPQSDLIRKRLQEYEELELRQFSLHDARYDDYDGAGRYGDDDDEESGTFAEGIPLHDDDGHDIGTRRSSDQYDPSLRHFGRKLAGDHIEHLHSDDENEYGSPAHPTPFAKAGRVQSIDSIQSAHSSAALSEQGRRKSSIASSSVQSSMNSIHTHRTQNSNASPTPGGDTSSPQHKPANTEVESTKSGQAPVDDGLLDFKDRIVAPLNPVTGSENQEAKKPLLVPSSSSSSISSSIRKYPRHRTLHHHSSRSSMTTTSSLGAGHSRSSVHFSKAHDYVANSWNACETGEDGAGKGTTWDEYWDEYYRPKVQTSFQRLFAYNMNSSSRYIPPKQVKHRRKRISLCRDSVCERLTGTFSNCGSPLLSLIRTVSRNRLSRVHSKYDRTKRSYRKPN